MFDKSRPRAPGSEGAVCVVLLGKELSDQARVFSQKEGVTLLILFLGAFQSLLHRYTGQEDLVIGTAIANRNKPELQNLIGFLINTVALRLEARENPSFRQLLDRAKSTAFGAYSNQDIPFDLLVDELRTERDLNRNPLFQVMFGLQAP